MFGQRLLLLIALLATVVVLGCWDDMHTMERVLAEGYDATARITGAENQRGVPLAVDGWRPRLAEQALSIDLEWKGRDGRDHVRKHVPVTESFAHTVVTGDQVHLVPVGIKALDDGSVPVVVTDASQRLASLKTWRAVSGAIALAAWAAVAALELLRRRFGQDLRGKAAAGQAGAGRGRSTPTIFLLRQLPASRTMAGLGLLVTGGALAFQAWSAGQAAEQARSEGTAVQAQILSVSAASGGGHSLLLSWTDANGAVHHFGPVPISNRFYGQITKDGQLTVHQTEIRTRDDKPVERPVIVADVPETGWLGRIGLPAGLVLLAIGAGLLISALRLAGRGGTSR